MAIRCCRYCKPPKRRCGCHSECYEYLSEKSEHDAMMAKHANEAKIEAGIIRQRNAAIRKTIGKKRTH